MGMGNLSCGVKCIKVLLFVFNFIFWLCGAALMGLGIWLIVDTGSLSKHDFLDVFVDGEGYMYNVLKYVSCTFVALGAFILMAGFCGCFGAIKELRILLSLYIIFMLIIIAAEVACVAIGFIYKDKYDKLKKRVDEKSERFFKEQYKGNGTASYSFRFIEQHLECCGMDGPYDYANSSYGRVSEWCCKWGSGGYSEDVLDLKNAAECKIESNCFYDNIQNCPTMETYSEGCFDKIINYHPIFIWVSLGIAISQLIGLIFAICLCKAIGKENISNFSRLTEG